LMLDSAGALFGIYLLTGFALSIAGRVMRIRKKSPVPARG
jgi:hypothetical protein